MSTQQPTWQGPLNIILIIIILLLLGYIFFWPAGFMHSFRDLNRTIERTNTLLESQSSKLAQQYEPGSFANADTALAENLNSAYERIRRARHLSDSTYNELELLKQNLVAESDGYDNSGFLADASNERVSNSYFTSEERAENLRLLLAATKDSLLNIINQEQRASLDTVLITTEQVEGPDGSKAWADYYLDAPLGASVTMLSKFQQDIRVLESYTLQSLTDGIATDYNNRLMVQLDNLRTEAETREMEYRDRIAAADRTPSAPRTDRAPSEPRTTTPAPTPSPTPTPKPTPTPTPTPTPSATDTRSATRNSGPATPFRHLGADPFIIPSQYPTLYVGVDNPVKIYHPELGRREHQLSISNGRIEQRDGEYIARVSRPGPTTVTLSLKDRQGNFVPVKTERFASRNIPKPKVVIQNQSGGTMAASVFRMQNALRPDVTELERDLGYSVLQYNMTHIDAATGDIIKMEGRGSYFSGQIHELVQQAERGDIYIFDNILVKGPDGRNIEVDGVIFNID